MEEQGRAGFARQARQGQVTYHRKNKAGLALFGQGQAPLGHKSRTGLALFGSKTRTGSPPSEEQGRAGCLRQQDKGRFSSIGRAGKAGSLRQQDKGRFPSLQEQDRPEIPGLAGEAQIFFGWRGCAHFPSAGRTYFVNFAGLAIQSAMVPVCQQRDSNQGPF